MGGARGDHLGAASGVVEGADASGERLGIHPGCVQRTVAGDLAEDRHVGDDGGDAEFERFGDGQAVALVERGGDQDAVVGEEGRVLGIRHPAVEDDARAGGVDQRLELGAAGG